MLRTLIRVDTAPELGAGHLMRCLTLAGELRRLGSDVVLVIRDRPALDLTPVRRAGWDVRLLSRVDTPNTFAGDSPPHGAWLGATQERDYDETAAAMREFWPRADRIVIDHYGIDARWERRCRNDADRILVIDDLADRDHDCDLLVDQTFGRNSEDYRDRVPAGCHFLIGARYAMLRPEFARLRQQALARRQNTRVEQVLVSFGGYDPDNATGRVLEELDAARDTVLRIRVILGAGAPHIEKVGQLCRDSFHEAELLTGVSNMAEHMLESDISIGSGGTVAWERCCLGLPCLVITTASNQDLTVRCLADAGAIEYLGTEKEVRSQPGLITRAFARMRDDGQFRSTMAERASAVIDGRGAARVATALIGEL